MANNVGVAVVGDVLDINTWSNIPWYFYEAGERHKMFNQPWRLDTSKFGTSRVFWNAWRIVNGKGKGGYQYSESFLKKAESMIDPSFFASTVISFNQLFPRASSVKKAGGKIFYYIDTTLDDLFNAESYGVQIPDDLKQKALALEKENYHSAEAVVSMGSWVRRSLSVVYGLPPEKINTIMPGANLPANVRVVQGVSAGQPGIDHELVLGFIGKDWQRKGLRILLDIRDELQRRNYKAKVLIIGNCPEEFRSRNGVEYSGFIDKKVDLEKFIKAISSCHIGCLFSKDEALGISVLEFLRAGIPVAGYAHQGTLDTMIPGTGLRFDPGESVAAMTDSLVGVITSPGRFVELRARAQEASSLVTWDNTILQWKKILGR